MKNIFISFLCAPLTLYALTDMDVLYPHHRPRQATCMEKPVYPANPNLWDTYKPCPFSPPTNLSSSSEESQLRHLINHNPQVGRLAPFGPNPKITKTGPHSVTPMQLAPNDILRDKMLKSDPMLSYMETPKNTLKSTQPPLIPSTSYGPFLENGKKCGIDDVRVCVPKDLLHKAINIAKSTPSNKLPPSPTAPTPPPRRLSATSTSFSLSASGGRPSIFPARPKLLPKLPSVSILTSASTKLLTAMSTINRSLSPPVLAKKSPTIRCPCVTLQIAETLQILFSNFLSILIYILFFLPGEFLFRCQFFFMRFPLVLAIF
jgi:hypothetical protein